MRSTTGSREPDFFAELLVALDRELGFEPWDGARARAVLDSADPAPISAESIAEVVGRVRRDPPHRGRGPRARRLLLPLGALMLAAATITYCRWQGNYSTRTLRYEPAFQILFDQSRTLNQRRSAQSVIYVGMKSNLDALREVATEPGPVGEDATLALDRARHLIAGTVPPAFMPQAPRWHTHDDLLARIADQLLTSAERRAALREATLLFEAGVRVLREVQAEDPVLRQDSEIWFSMLVNVLDGKQPNEVRYIPR